MTDDGRAHHATCYREHHDCAVDRLDDIRESWAATVGQPCDERAVHCACVPPLREEVERLKKQIEAQLCTTCAMDIADLRGEEE